MRKEIPRGRDFSPRVKWTLMGGAVLFVLGMAVVLIKTNPNRRHTPAHSPISTTDSSQAIANITALDATHYPPLLMNNWAVWMHGKAYPLIKQGDQWFANVDGHRVPLQGNALLLHNGQGYALKDGKVVPLPHQAGAIDQPLPGDIVEKNGHYYVMGQDGKLHPYHAKPPAGQVVWKNGKAYVMGKDGKLHAVGDHPQAGQLVEKDGHYYRVGKDGKLHPYAGQPAAGQVVWKHGKAYVMGKDGKLHAVGDHPQAGQLVEKDGQYYQVGKDGKLHPYLGPVKAGQTVWKNGKAYVMGKDGKLHAVANGALKMIHGQPYHYENGHWVPATPKGVPAGTLIADGKGHYYQVGKDGKLHPYLGPVKAGQIVWKNGKPYRVNAAGQLVPLKPGETFVGADGRHYQLKNGHIVPLQAGSRGSGTTSSGAGQAKGQAHGDDGAYHSALVVYQNSAAKPAPKAAKTDQAADNALAALGAAEANAAASIKPSDAFATQNNQAGKAAFLSTSQAGPTAAKGQLAHPTSPYTLFAGTLISASLQSGINSDLPGQILARVTEDVFDTRTGNYLLVPQGTLIQGVYDSHIAYGQSRVLVVFTRLIFPNGTSIPLENQPGADLLGYAGLSGHVNNHYIRIFGNALMFSIFGALGQLSQPNSSGDSPSNQQIIYAAVGQELTQTAAKMLQKNMNIQPTIKATPGTDFNILITRDMVFPHVYRFDREGE